MTTEAIIANVSDRLGISELNPMQLAVASCTASRIVLLAPTGSGKTVAFAIALLRNLSDARPGLQAVVLAPSRELVLQIADVLRRIADGLKVVAVYGGHSMADEVNSLKSTPSIIVATPGRLLDHINRATVDVSDVHSVVIDEYDKSLELGFQREMAAIIKHIARIDELILTSATPLAETPKWINLKGAEIVDFSVKLYDPRGRIDVARVESPARDKADTLINLLRTLSGGKSLVFVNHRESAERLHDILRRTGLKVGIYHGGLDQNERRKAMTMFANGSLPILVTTDLAARGLDIDNLDAVIHYHMPTSEQAWLHRNGRTARAGMAGRVFIITSEADNIPEYINWDHDFVPTKAATAKIGQSDFTTLHFNAGKKEKISRGDIVGFLCRIGGLSADEIGKIDIDDHQAFVAIKTDKVAAALAAIAHEKIKGKRVRITPVKA